MAKKQESNGSFKEFWGELSKNRFGLIGCGLSLLQLVVHTSWLLFIMALTSSGQADQLDPNAWQLWLVTVLMIVGGLLTMVSLFVCLYGAVHGKPKVLAIIGMMLSFFVGTMTTFVLLINAFG